ncbi:MAG: hypothetical protein ACRDT8_00135 [Micromonosporaceae bacterium]
MAGRIITMQRQARELGRLRTGLTDYSGPKARPVRSSTWIVTSHARHYVEAAAEVWGGTPEQWQPLGNGAQQWRVVTEASTLDAILPPGDPLSQAYELWSKGGAQRRCDGASESLTGGPCLCRQEFGEEFWADAPRDKACKVTTRLNVILPEMPDIGAWRVETHSYYGANEMAAAVDVLKGSIGDKVLIPVRLRIEQRTRVAEGKTKQFPVIAVELRGATAGQVLAGQAPRIAVEGAAPQRAIEQGDDDRMPPIDYQSYEEDAAEAMTIDAWREVWNAARKNGHLNDRMKEILKPYGEALKAIPGPALDPVDRDPEKLDELWNRVVSAAPDGMTMTQLEELYAERNEGQLPSAASVAQLDEFLAAVKALPPGEKKVPF